MSGADDGPWPTPSSKNASEAHVYQELSYDKMIRKEVCNLLEQQQSKLRQNHITTRVEREDRDSIFFRKCYDSTSRNVSETVPASPSIKVSSIENSTPVPHIRHGFLPNKVIGKTLPVTDAHKHLHGDCSGDMDSLSSSGYASSHAIAVSIPAITPTPPSSESSYLPVSGDMSKKGLPPHSHEQYERLMDCRRIFSPSFGVSSLSASGTLAASHNVVRELIPLSSDSKKKVASSQDGLTSTPASSFLGRDAGLYQQDPYPNTLKSSSFKEKMVCELKVESLNSRASEGSTLNETKKNLPFLESVSHAMTKLSAKSSFPEMEPNVKHINSQSKDNLVMSTPNKDINPPANLDSKRMKLVLADDRKVAKKRDPTKTTKEKESQWMNQYRALRSYHTIHGHANVPMHFAENKRLGHWVNNQRQLYRKFKSGLSSSMTEERIKLLEDLGFAWVLGKDWKHKMELMKKEAAKKEAAKKEAAKNEDQKGSGQNYTIGPKVKNFKPTLHTSTQVMNDGKHENQISMKSSEICTNKEQNGEDNAITNRAELDRGEGANPQNETNELCEGAKSPSAAKRQNRKCSRPPKLKINGRTVSHVLFSATDIPKSKPHNKANSPQNIRSPTQARNVSSPIQSRGAFHGFGSNIYASSSSNVKHTSDDPISKNFPLNNSFVSDGNMLKSKDVVLSEKKNHRKEEYHSQNIDSLLVGGETKKSQDTPSTSFSSIDPYLEKEEINLSKPIYNGLDKSWMKRLDDITKFKAEHGHCNVPFQYSVNKSLGYWVHNQRQIYKDWTNGKPCSLTQERIDSLIKLGFNFGPRRQLKRKRSENEEATQSRFTSTSEVSKDVCQSDSSAPEITSSQVTSELKYSRQHKKSTTVQKHDYLDNAWNRRLAELREYKEMHDHCDVPSVYPLNRPLGTWVMNQRQQYRRFQGGEKSSMTEERIKALDELGFRWYVGKGMKASKRDKGRDETEVGADPYESGSVKRSEEQCLYNSTPNNKINNLLRRVKVGVTLAVYWDEDKKFYPARVRTAHRKRRQNAGKGAIPYEFTIEYVDGETERVDLRVVPFKLIDDDEDSLESVKSDDDSIDASLSDAAHALYTLATPNVSPINMLSDDLIHSIMCFLPTIENLVSFCLASKRTWGFIDNSIHSESLLRGAYENAFGENPLRRMVEDNRSSRFWRNTWDDVYFLRAGLKIQGSLDGDVMKKAREEKQKSQQRSVRKSVEILSKREESQAIFYDNQFLIASNDTTHYSAGYFGMKPFYVSLPSTRSKPPSTCQRINRPGRMEIQHKEQVAVWGDFNGIRIFNSSEDMVFGNKEDSNEEGEIRFHSVGENDGGGQVLALALPPLPAKSDINRKVNSRRPCLYLGRASGAVMGVSLTSKEGEQEKYVISTRTAMHTNEVVALCLLPSAGKGKDREQLLVSGGYDGRVYVYPKAFSEDGGFRLDDAILACTNTRVTPILSVAATEMSMSTSSTNTQILILCTGDSLGNITIWGAKIPPIYDVINQAGRPFKPPPGYCLEDIYKFVPIQIYSSCQMGARVTRLDLVRGDVLISGNTAGDVSVWDLVQCKYTEKEINAQTMTSDVESEPSPNLVLRFNIPAAHGGTIEAINIFGNVLLTSGGNDGFIRGWDINCGDLLGSVLCHEGKMVTPTETTNNSDTRSLQRKHRYSREGVKSAVVGHILMGDKSLVSLCRDGSLYLWQYGVIGDAKIDLEIKKPSWMEVGQIEGRVLTAAATLSNLSGKSGSALLLPESYPSSRVLKLERLRQIMTCDGDSCPSKEKRDLRDKMRFSIIMAAYEHATHPEWQKLPETPFIGADGKKYAYIKKAFAEFSGMKPCIKCRKVTKGAYTCRLQLQHDSSDVDNPWKNSLNTLRSVINHIPPTKFTDDEMTLYSNEGSNCNGEDSGLGEAKLKEDDDGMMWECHRCTLLNKEIQNKCSLCGSFKGGKRCKIKPLSRSSTEKSRFSTEEGKSAASKIETILMPEIEKKADQGLECKQLENSDSSSEKYSTVLIEKEDSWECHKCLKINSYTNKRCKGCSSWKGGKRTSNGCSSWECVFCQFKNEKSTSICAMCHESVSHLQNFKSVEKSAINVSGKGHSDNKVKKRMKRPSTELSQSELDSAWECHKCNKLNADKNKRCRFCSSWKGGRRTTNGNFSKKLNFQV